MANDQIVPGTQFAAIIEQKWKPDFAMVANEEMVVGSNFSKAGDGVQQIGNLLNISKVDTTTTNTLAATGTAIAARGELTYNLDTELNITVSPTRVYSGIQVTRNAESRLLRYPAYLAAKKEQLVKGISTQIDVTCANLATSLITNVIGGAAQDFNLAFLTAGIAKLAQGAKENWKPGTNNAYLCVWTLQIDDILGIQQITGADFRGDSANPAVSGWVWKGFGVNINESGNIARSGGVAYNLLHIPESHVLAYNEEPNILPEQPDGLLKVYIATAEFGAAEVFDEYAVAMLTKDT